MRSASSPGPPFGPALKIQRDRPTSMVMGFLAWLRRTFLDSPRIIERTATASDTPAPTTPSVLPSPVVIAPQTATASVAPGGAGSAQIAAMLDRTLYRGEVVDMLVQTLKGATREAKSSGDRLFVSFLLRTVTNEGVNLPALPDVVVKIQRILGRADCGTQEIEQAIACEPMVTTKVIGVASSPIYRRQSPVRGLHDAINRVGQRETKNIVMAILSKTRLFRVPGFETQAVALYRGSLASALTMQTLAGHIGLDPDHAFIAGLVHSLGEVVLLSAASEVHRSSRGQSQVSEEMMKKLSEVIHPLLGALVAETWEFDPAVVSAIEHHHHPELAFGPARRLAEALVVSDEVAQRLLAGIDASNTVSAAPAFTAIGIRHPEVVLEQARTAFEAFEGATREETVPAPTRRAPDARVER